MRIPHSRPLIDKEDINAVTDVLASGHIAQGEKVREFETRIANFIGTKYGIAISSGTSAIHLALVGLDVGPEDEVIVPSYVCASPYMAILYIGAKPKIVDINPSDFNLCASTLKEKLTSKTKAVIVPHMFGNPAELDELLELEIPIIEDCAQSLGAEYKKRRVGSYGRLSVYSFYATKMITTGEGGMVLTNNQEIYRKIIEIREYNKKDLSKLRFNYKMTDIQAELGLSQLKKLPSFIKRRKEIASTYNKLFSKLDVQIPRQYSHKKSVFFRYVILLERLNHIQKASKRRGIMCEKPVWKPLHKSLNSTKCPNSDYVYNHALSIPLYPSLTKEEIEYVIENLEVIFHKIK